jgi:Na+/H+ antiporter NhaC
MTGRATAAGLAAIVLALAAAAPVEGRTAAGDAPGPTDPPVATYAERQAAAGVEADPEPELDAPNVILRSAAFDLEVRRPEGEGAPLPYRLVTASGRELAAGELAPGDVAAVEDVTLASADELPLSLVAGDAGRRVASADPPFLPGWISLLPPLLAIALALVFREVVISLFLGVWLGAFFYAGLDPVGALWRSIDRFAVPALADADHAAIIVFSLLLGGMVGVMAKSGGTRGIVQALRPVATTPRRAQLATYLSGLGIFFDDYANTLIVGNTMRPITDAMRVSREKLAYIVDSTAAPISAIVFVSTWVGFEISLIGDGLQIAAGQAAASPEMAAELAAANPFTVFIHSIPYLFYPILALIMVGLVIWTQRDFGPMWAAENRASRGDGLYREGAMLMSDTSGGAMDAKEGAPERWYNAALPVLTVIFVVLGGLYFGGRAEVGPGADLWSVFGAADPFAALLWGSLAGCVVAILLAVGQRILDPREAIEAWLGGLRAMVLAAVILVLAWSLSEVTEVLGTASYLAGALSEALPIFLLPVLTFVTGAAIAFATGTSWGTMAILLPIVIPLAVSLGGGIDFEGGARYTVLLGSISAVMAGAIWGDHCSPISDTTVMSSMGTACDHMDHVRTQLPYALLVGAVAMAVGDVPTALGMSPWISYAAGAVILFLVLRFLGRPDHASPQWSGGGGG